MEVAQLKVNCDASYNNALKFDNHKLKHNTAVLCFEPHCNHSFILKSGKLEQV